MDSKGDTIHQYIETRKKFQENILKFIDNDDDVEENYQNLNKNYETLKIGENRSELKIFLSTLAKTVVFHYHSTNFFKKLEQIIKSCKDDILKHFSNTGIYDIFQDSNRILLFLLEEKILQLNTTICQNLPNYYFYPELKSFYNSEFGDQEISELVQSHPDEYQQNRKAAVDETYRCKLIRDDDIDNFIKYINQENISINEKFKLSEFSELYNREYSMTCIEYAAYHGSIQIFKYLFKNGAELQNNIWNYVVHGRNPEIFQFLEENKVNFKKDQKKIDQMFLHAIKCHHNEVAEYIQANYRRKKISKNFILTIEKVAIEYFNFQYFPENLNDDHLETLINFDYFTIFECLFKSTKINSDKNYLRIAFDKDNVEIFKTIFENSQKVDGLNNFFIRAIEEEKVQILEFLLSQKIVDVNKKYYMNDFGEYDDEKADFSKEILDQYDKDIDINKIQNELNDNPVNYDSDYFTEITPLYVAAQKGFDKIVSLLLSDPNIDVNINSVTCKCRKFYLQKNYRHDYSDNEDEDENCINLFIVKIESPLIVSIRKKYFEITQNLLSNHKINVNKKLRFVFDLVYNLDNLHYVAYESKTALYSAIENGNNDIIVSLLSNSNIDVNLESLIIDSKFSKFLDDAFKKQKFKNKTDFYNSIVIPTQKLQNAIDIAIELNNTQIIEILSEKHDVKINNDNNAAHLLNAIKNGNFDLFKKILDHFDSIDEDLLINALQNSIRNKNVEMVKTLLDREDVDVNSIFDGKSPIEIAAQVGDVDVFNLLLSRPDIDVNNRNGEKTPLKEAVDNKQIEIVKLLLNRHDIDFNPKLI